MANSFLKTVEIQRLPDTMPNRTVSTVKDGSRYYSNSIITCPLIHDQVNSSYVHTLVGTAYRE